MKRLARLILFLTLVVASALLLTRFLSDNEELVQLRFINWRTKEISQALLTLIAFLSGIGLAIVLLFSAVVSKSMQVRRLRRENEALQRLVEAQSQNKAG